MSIALKELESLR